MKNYGDVRRFNRFLQLFGLVLGTNAVLWFMVYTGLLGSIPLFNVAISGSTIGYYGFWNSIVVIYCIASFAWLIVEA